VVFAGDPENVRTRGQRFGRAHGGENAETNSQEHGLRYQAVEKDIRKVSHSHGKAAEKIFK